MKKILGWALKLGFSVLVLGILLWKARHDGSLAKLVEHDKNWLLLAAGGAAMLSTLVLQFCRWRVLVRAIDMRLSVGEALRLGFMGQLFSLVGVGMLGGDALKTFFLGRNNKGRMTEALATVFVDRLVGLYALVLLAGLVCLFFDPGTVMAGTAIEREGVKTLCWLAPWGAVVSTAAIGILMLPGVTAWTAWDSLTHIPKLGPSLEKLVRALRVYRRRPVAFGAALSLSIVIHVCNALAFYAISLGLPAFDDAGGLVEKPSFIAHAAAALLALATGALPVGALEVVFNVVYRSVASDRMPEQQGFLIVITYRLLQMCIALIGLYYYLAGRREVDEVLHEAEVSQAQTLAGAPGRNTLLERISAYSLLARRVSVSTFWRSKRPALPATGSPRTFEAHA